MNWRKKDVERGMRVINETYVLIPFNRIENAHFSFAVRDSD